MDIYSLGVIILQLCTSFDFVGDVHDALEFEREDIDKMSVLILKHIKLDDTLPEEACSEIINVGLECVQDKRDKRPSLGNILSRLSKYQVCSSAISPRMLVPLSSNYTSFLISGPISRY